MNLIGPPPRPAGSPAPPPASPALDGRGEGARLWLVRHAEVDERWHDIAYGSLDVPLSPRGAEATASMGAAFRDLDVDRVLSSDLDRAARMGSAVSEACGAPLSLHASLREMDRGAWQGRPKAEFRALWDADAEAYWRDPYRWHVPGGEGDALIHARAWPRVEESLAEVGAGTLVVTAHGQLIRVLAGRLLGCDAPASYVYALDPAYAHLFIDGPGGWELAARNVGPAGVR